MNLVEQSHWWFVARRKIIRSVIKRLSLPKRCKILEIGCGTGGNLLLLSAYGSVDAIEMNENAVSIAREKYGDKARIFHGCLPGVPQDLVNQYDLICMFDVLEHIEDDHCALREVKSMLNSNGRLLLTVPAHNWLWGRHDEFLHHKRRYTMQKLKLSLNAGGLIPIQASYFNFWLFPIVALGRIYDKIFKPNSPTGTKIPPAGLNCLLQSIFASEKWLLNVTQIPVGVSLLAIAKKI